MEYRLDWYGSNDPRYHAVSNWYSDGSLKFDPMLNVLVGIKGRYTLRHASANVWVGVCNGIKVAVVISKDRKIATVCF